MSRLDENLSLSLERENRGINEECEVIDLYENNENSENNCGYENEILNREYGRIELNKENKCIDFVNGIVL
jgi:hypothetical protein